MPNARPRADWDSYFMAMAFLVARRSPDVRTQHGSVIVGDHNQVLGVGYNGTPRGGEDSTIYDWMSEQKYSWSVHSEQNSILACDHRPKGARIYITGKPCSNCTLSIIQSGIEEVIYGPMTSKMDINWKLSEKILANHGIRYRAYTKAREPNGAIDTLQEAIDKLTEITLN